MKDRASFSLKPGVFTRQSAASHQSCFTKDRLVSLDGLERQNIEAPAPFSGAGLWFVPVAHEGNQSYSAEEVERVAAIVEFLTQPGTSWTDRDGRQQPLTRDDILIVAPYNDQVNRLTAAVARREGGNGRQVSGAGGGRRYLLDDDVDARRRAAGAWSFFTI